MNAPHSLPTLLLAAAWTLPGPVAAQSLLNQGGLGLPVDAVDARSRALGSPGVGLFGAVVSPGDPAAAADLTAAELTFTLRHSWVDLQGPAEPDAGGSRFPVIGLGYPLYDHGIVTLTFGSELDQRWQVRQEGEVELSEELVGVEDRFVSDGGVSAARLGFARRLGSDVAVGFSVGRYTGDVVRSFSRRFDTLSIGGSLPTFVRGGRWSYGGTTVAAGAQADVGDFLRVAGSATWSGDLEASPSPDTEGAAATFSVPTRYRAGASGALTPTLSLVLGVDYADWSEAGEDLGGRAALGWGGGLELDEVTLGGRPMPFRVGYRSTDLAFGFDGEQPTESAWTAGLGLGLADSEIARASVDVSVEAGDRSAGSLSESFWRASLTVRVGGN